MSDELCLELEAYLLPLKDIIQGNVQTNGVEKQNPQTDPTHKIRNGKPKNTKRENQDLKPIKNVKTAPFPAKPKGTNIPERTKGIEPKKKKQRQ